MKIMKNEIMKKLLAVALCLAVAAACFLAVPAVEVQAADDDILYIAENNRTNFETYFNAHQAPNYTDSTYANAKGYLFAGWYSDNQGNSPIVTLDEAGDAVYAKFVKANLCGVAVQAKIGTSSTDLRIVSVVDGLNYAAVGFNAYVRQVDTATGVLKQEVVLSEYASENNLTQSTKVYTHLNVYKDGVKDSEKTPEQALGRETGWYFSVMKVSGIPAKRYDDSIIAVQPYWITLDGTYVPGLMEYNRANDSTNKIVNVTINVLDSEAFAAGGLRINYNESDFVFEGYDYGRVFGSEFYLADHSTYVQAYGNTGYYDNVENSTGAFVNLRFKKTDSNIGPGDSLFAIVSPDFDAYDKTSVEVCVPDGRY